MKPKFCMCFIIKYCIQVQARFVSNLVITEIVSCFPTWHQNPLNENPTALLLCPDLSEDISASLLHPL